MVFLVDRWRQKPEEKKEDFSFTDQKPRIATEEDIKGKWGGRQEGFRCHMCGYKFRIGDYWRWVNPNRPFKMDNKEYWLMPFLVCDNCDNYAHIYKRWEDHVKEGYKKYWWLVKEE